MSIDEIYQAAKARGLVRSLRHFSQISRAARPTTLSTPASPGAAPGHCSTCTARLGELRQLDLLIWPGWSWIRRRSGRSCDRRSCGRGGAISTARACVR